MRYAQVVIGILLLVKGIKDAIALPAALSAVHVGAAVPGFSTGYAVGYAAGQTTGMVIGTLAVLAGGVMLILNGWARRRTRTGFIPAP